MRLWLWFAVCLGTIGLVRSDVALPFNFFDPFNIFSPHRENPNQKTHIDSTVLFNIHQAINAQKPDEDAIIKIISAGTHGDLFILKSRYQSYYGLDLGQSLKNIFTGELEEAMISWMSPRNNYYAQEIYSAVHGMGADERALIDILCIFNNSIVQQIDYAYYGLFQRSMKDDLINKLPKSFERLLHLSKEPRAHDKFRTDNVLEIVEDELSFINFLTSHPTHIFQFAMEYYKQSGKYLENKIMEKYSGDLQRALLSIVYYAKGENRFFARRLRDILEGDTVDYRSLIRLAIMEKKVSYNQIRDIFNKQYKKNLDEIMTKRIASEHFRKFIQALFQRKQNIPEVYATVTM